MNKITPPDKYFCKRVGFCHWEVWVTYEDGYADPVNGSTEWNVIWGVRFYRKITAMKIAQDLQTVFYSGHSHGQETFLRDVAVSGQGYGPFSVVLGDVIDACRELSFGVLTAGLAPGTRTRVLAVKEAVRRYDKFLETQIKESN